MAQFHLPYHKTGIEFEIADDQVVGVLESRVNHYRAEGSQESLIEAALDQPIGSDSLETLVRGKASITIVTSDHTRPVPSRLTMPILLRRIRGVEPDIRITILIATGYHRAMTPKELTDRFGEDIVQNECIVVHDSRDEASLVQLERLPSGGELWVNRAAIETDLLIAEGFIEPHFFAGFSGGRKSILPGIAGYQTVLANHCGAFIAHAKARAGMLDGNPIHTDMLFAAEQAKLSFVLNVVLNEKKEVIHAVAGDFKSAHVQGCNFLRQFCEVPAAPADIVITTNGGYPLDQNIYQSVKGMTAAEATCKEGGVIIIAAGCCDGHGGEAFYHTLAEGTPESVWQTALKVPMEETIPDQWESQILARILRRFTVILVSDLCDPQMIRDMHMLHASTMNDALSKAFELKGEYASVTVVPDGVGVIVKK